MYRPGDARWGAVQRELEVAKMRYLADYESLYLERDQVCLPTYPPSPLL